MTEMEVNTFLWLSGLFCWVGREELHLKARQYLAMKHSEMESRLSQKEELEYYHFPLIVCNQIMKWDHEPAHFGCQPLSMALVHARMLCH